jgi:signal transduction histidine kinase
MTPDSVANYRGHRAQRLLRCLVDASPDAIYLYYPRWHRIAVLGRQAKALLGSAALPSRRLRLADLERRVHPADRAGFREYLAALERARDGDGDGACRPGRSHELRIMGADGHYRWLSSRGTVLARTPDGRASKVLVASQDLTDVKQARQALSDLSGRLYQLREEERQRIAQELHDSTAQHLVAATLNLMTLRAKCAAQPGVHALLESIESSLEEATRELRTFTYLLHPLALEKDGLERTLRTYLDGFARRTGLEAQLTVAGDVERLPFPLQCSLLRIIQEALANVHRHAAAAHVSIGLRRRSDALRLTVADDGRGMPRIEGLAEGRLRTGMGIPGMKARLRELGGRLEIRSGPEGTTIVAIVPLAAARVWPASGATAEHQRAQPSRATADQLE